MQPYWFPLIKGPPSLYTTTLTNYTDITGLTATILPGGSYLVQSWFQYVTSSTTTTIKVGLGFTGNTVAPTVYKVSIRSGSGDGTTERESPVIPDTGTATTAITTAGTYSAFITGVVVVGTTGGTLSVQIAHGAAPAATIATNAGLLMIQQIG